MAGFGLSRLLATVLALFCLVLLHVNAGPARRSNHERFNNHESRSTDEAPDGHHYLLGVGKGDITGFVGSSCGLYGLMKCADLLVISPLWDMPA
jgi:hypothetical protein